MGAVEAPQMPSIHGVSRELRNSLWNCIVIALRKPDLDKRRIILGLILMHEFYRPIDEIDSEYQEVLAAFRRAFFDADWHKVLDVIESMAAMLGEHGVDDELFGYMVNYFLEDHFSGFRLIDGRLMSIVEEVEIASVHKSIDATQSGFYGAGTQIRKAAALLSQRPEPDYLNCIKESISAVESIIKQLMGEKGGGIKLALNRLDEALKLHPSLKTSILKLYGYASDEDGIRHAILEKSHAGFNEAKFALVTCSAIANFLIAIAADANLLPAEND
jgi:hypothetical protein